jgi:hypothetical protein
MNLCTHTMDQKTNNPDKGRSKFLSEISLALDQLKATCIDIENHQLVWARTRHQFKDNFISPSKLLQNFDNAQFSSKF